MNWTLLIYWLIVLVVAIAILVIQAKKNTCGVLDYAGMVVNQLISSPHWRLAALYVLAALFTVSAMLAGFGKPLLISSANEAEADLVERIGSNKVATITSQLDRLWQGTNSLPSVSAVAKAKTVAAERTYPSWWHWIWAIFLLFAALIYTFIAFWDIAKRALRAAIHLVERKKRLIKNNPAVTTKPSASSTPTTSVVKDSFWRLLNIEVLGEFLSEFIKLILKKMA